MEAYIQANALLVYAIVMVAAALLHWGQKVNKGEATAEFVRYWLTETPGYSVGTLGALVGAWWLVYTTRGLDGMAAHMVVETAFATGWFINSAVSRGALSPATIAPPKQGGFIRPGTLLLLAALAAVFTLGGCLDSNRVKPAPPQGVPEKIEAAELLIGKISDRLVKMSCSKFQSGRCIEPGKPLMPDDALKAHTRVLDVQKAIQKASRLATDGWIDCLGQPRQQEACVNAAGDILVELDAWLIQQGGTQ